MKNFWNKQIKERLKIQFEKKLIICLLAIYHSKKWSRDNTRIKYTLYIVYNDIFQQRNCIFFSVASNQINQLGTKERGFHTCADGVDIEIWKSENNSRPCRWRAGGCRFDISSPIWALPDKACRGGGLGEGRARWKGVQGCRVTTGVQKRGVLWPKAADSFPSPPLPPSVTVQAYALLRDWPEPATMSRKIGSRFSSSRLFELVYVALYVA